MKEVTRITNLKLNDDGSATCTATLADSSVTETAKRLLEQDTETKFGLRGFVQEGNLSVVTFDLINK